MPMLAELQQRVRRDDTAEQSGFDTEILIRDSRSALRSNQSLDMKFSDRFTQSAPRTELPIFGSMNRSR